MPNARKKIAIGLAAFAVYLSVALWLKHSYVPPNPPPAGTVLELKRPFGTFVPGDAGAYYALAPSLDSEADQNGKVTSPYVVYEDSRLLGPGHALHGNLGHGRFSHWKGIGFIISSSDGTNPNMNGRKYRVVLPPWVLPP